MHERNKAYSVGWESKGRETGYLPNLTTYHDINITTYVDY